jgi:peptide/nickel transport system ATP-binding protein
MSTAGSRERPLLICDRVAITAAGDRKLVENVSFSINPGTVTGLVGESGSGKTLLARAILNLLPPGISLTSGRILLAGEEVSQYSRARMTDIRGSQIGMIFQEPMVSLNPALKIGIQMTEALQHHFGTASHEARSLALSMLHRVKIPEPERCIASYPHEFSGGMRQRIMIASVMLMKPKLLIADEPSTALDTLSQRDVLELVCDLTKELGSAVLLITHDIGLVRRHASHIVVMRQGRLVESGHCESVFECPQDPYTSELIATRPQPKTRTPDPLQKDRIPIIEVESVSVDYRRRRSFFKTAEGRQAVRRASFVLGHGETLAIVGGSGSGKTTLAHAVAGAVPYSAGVIRYRGNDIRRLSAHDLRSFAMARGIVFQDPYSSLDPHLTIAAIVEEPLRHKRRMTKRERLERVSLMLAEVGLTGYEQRFPHQLSGGQRQRAAIARAIIGEPELVIADEPVSALDVTIQRQILELITALQRRHGFACLVISHDLGAVSSIADRIMVMKDGEIIEHGECRAVLQDPKHSYTRALIEASPYYSGDLRGKMHDAV